MKVTHFFMFLYDPIWCIFCQNIVEKKESFLYKNNRYCITVHYIHEYGSKHAYFPPPKRNKITLCNLVCFRVQEKIL